MGCYKQSPALIVIVAALLLLTPLAYGQVPSVGTGLVRGIVCCTRTGNCANGSPRLSGVKVNLNCTNLLTGAQTLVQGVTNSVGVYNLILPNLPGVLSGVSIDRILRCNVVVKLPLNSTVCPILSTVNGILIGVPTLVNTLLNTLLGPLLVFVVQVLHVVAITV